MINPEIITKYNKPGPRYTSYPPANFFSDKYTIDNFKKDLVDSNSHKPENISLYIHIPFCPKICYFCGCTTELARGNDILNTYIDTLIKEIENVSESIDKSRKVSQIHWGGGTPNSIAYKHIERVMNKIKSIYSFTDNCEIAMECSPAYLSLKNIEELAAMGFNRISLGIQDFNTKVLDIVNRAHAKHEISDLISKMREHNFTGINLDFIYGLPEQTSESFRYNIEKAIELNPDRIVTFSYAHVPWVKSSQKVLEEIGLPDANLKLKMFTESYEMLTNAGYKSIGMDHYAKSTDELSKAFDNHLLHRNFQGYCTRATTGQVYAFGSSSISQLANAYAQNSKNVDDYIKSVNETGFATIRGYSLSKEEEIIRDVINEVMCNGHMSFDTIASENSTTADTVKELIKFDEAKLIPYIKDNLMTFDNNTVKVNENGMLVVRNIAMEFDPMLMTGNNLYSKTI